MRYTEPATVACREFFTHRCFLLRFAGNHCYQWIGNVVARDHLVLYGLSYRTFARLEVRMLPGFD